MSAANLVDDPLCSPPGYEAASSVDEYLVDKTGRTRRGYTSLPVDDEDTPELEEGQSFSSTLSKLGLSIDRGVVTGSNSGSISTDDICEIVIDCSPGFVLSTDILPTASLLLSQEFPDQAMYMRITGYHARTTKEETESQLQAFSFSVPMMSCQNSQASLFALADDMPCLRGGRVKISSNEEEMLARGTLSKGWNIAADAETHEMYHSNHDACMPASAESVSQMKARFKNVILPPWLPLGQAWTQMWQEDQSPGRVIEKDAIRKAIGLFLHDKSLAWCRWLIVPQTAYGWDFHFIEEELNKYIEQPSFFGALAGPKAISYISTSLGVIDNDLQPAFALRLFSSKKTERLYRNLRFSMLWSIVCSVCFLIFYFSVLFVSSVEYRHGKASGTTLITLIACLMPSLFFMALVVVLLPAQEIVYCNVGLARALKSWTSVNIPPSSSRQEVIEILHLRDRSFAGTPDDNIYLQRRSDGWYLMAGMKETDWLGANRSAIEKAIKERKNGPLDIASTVELNIVRQRLAQYEADEI